MRYMQMNEGGQYPYPEHNVKPEEKGRDWCMSYAKAAYYDFSFAYPKGVFANNGGDYEKNRMYALGKQPNGQYKKWLGVDQEANNTWLSVDWSIRSVVSGYRDRVISKIMKEDYGFVCTPVDSLAQTELDDYYAKIKAKLLVRQLLMKENPELADQPILMMESGDPLDIEELEMRYELGEQFNRSKDAELAIDLVLYENNYDSVRRSVIEDLFDFGVAGYKDYLGTDGKAKYRRVNPEATVVSFSRDPFFRDIIHAGEVVDVSLIDLATATNPDGSLVFTEDEIQEFAGSIAGKFGNPTTLGLGTGRLKPYDKFKCKVLDIEFYTYNEQTYTDRKDSNGNPVFIKEETGRGSVENPRYKRKKIQYTYKCKWIVGTDKAYDYGMCYDQKRKNEYKNKAQAKLSYTFVSYNFYEMKAQSFMSKLIPYIDDYQLTMLKIQNFKNRAVPSGWWIDLDALENVALNKGGQNMQPKELLQMFFETGVLIGRSVNANGDPQSPNWKPVIPIENTAASELAMFYQDLANTLSAIEKIVGFNDVTIGQPNPKTLVPGYEMASQSTSDAIYPISYAEEALTLNLAENMLCRMQQAIKKNGISGYAPALNSNMLRFIEVSPELALRDYGIQIDKRPTQDQKAFLMQMMQADIANGFLSTADAVTLINTKNAKQAQSIWAYRVKKEKERLQLQKMAEIQATNEGNAQAAQMAQQAAMQMKQMELEAELQKEQIRVQGELEKERMRIESQEKIAGVSSATKLQVASTTAQGKMETQHISNQKNNFKL